MPFLIASGIVLILALIVFVIVNYFFRGSFVRREDKNLDPAFFRSLEKQGMNREIEMIHAGRDYVRSLPYEDVYTPSHDGLSLRARYFKNGDGKQVLILVHGYKSRGDHDFSCAFEPYKNRGIDILLVDQRSHGKSEGKYICFGTKERFDVIRWCEFIIARNGEGVKIILDGISMGATTVLLAAGLPELPKNVVGVIADCGFTSARSEVAYVAKRDYHLPSFPAVNLMDLMCRLFAGFSLSEVSTVDAVKSIKVPVVFVHGEADDFVPCENSIRNFCACGSPQKWLYTVPNAGHGLSFLIDNSGVSEVLNTFFEAALSDKK
ncbi:MAG: alpha/beta hydrolase [Ruminococcaceae bacterium]|nr:alpha/beta hydrolase [Oscillospiraceae bacterium]